MDNKTEEKIAELQGIEQNLQKFLSQKQQFQTQMRKCSHFEKYFTGDCSLRPK